MNIHDQQYITVTKLVLRTLWAQSSDFTWPIDLPLLFVGKIRNKAFTVIRNKLLQGHKLTMTKDAPSPRLHAWCISLGKYVYI